MIIIRSWALVLVVILCCTGAARPQSATPTLPAVSFGIAGVSNGVLAFTSLEPQLDWPLVVQRDDSTEGVREVRLDVTPLASQSGRVEAVKLQKDGADLAGPLSLQPLEQVVVHLVGRIPDEGPYKGAIGLVFEGKRQSVSLTVTRVVREVAVVGASGGTLQLTTADPELTWPLTVRRTDNADGPRYFTIELGPLIAPSGQRAAAEIRPGAPTARVAVPPLGEATVDLVVKLGEEGVHTGDIALVVDGKRVTTGLKITRSLKDAAVRIEDITQVRTTLDAAQVALRVRLQEAEGLRTTVSLPELVRLDGKETKEGTASTQAQYSRVVVTRDGMPMGGNLVLDPRSTVDLGLRIEGLDKPGYYAGTLRVSSTSRKPVDKAFELALRRGTGWAVALILAGVILSAGVRLYMTVGRPSLAAQADAVTVRDDLTRFQSNNSDLNADEQRVLGAMLAQLDEVRGSAPNPAWGTPAAQVDEVRRKAKVFFRWIELRRRLDAVEPRDIGDPVRVKQRALATIFDDHNGSATLTEQALSNLQTYGTELTTAIQGRLARAIADLVSEIDRLPAAQLLELTETRRAVDEDARQKAADQDFDGANEILARARHAYVQASIKALQAGLDPNKPAAGFDNADWKTRVGDVNQRLNAVLAESDARQQIKDWNKVRIEWLRTLVQALAKQIDAELAELDKKLAGGVVQPGGPDPAAKAAFEKAKGELQKIDALLAAGKVQEAADAYATAATEHQNGRAVLTGTRQLGKEEETGKAQTGGDIPPEVLQRAWNAISFALGAPTTARQATARYLFAEGVLFLVLTAAALIVGLKFLYFDSPGWGSYTDLAVAFLWGFGLHAFAATSFQGVQSIAQQFAR